MRALLTLGLIGCLGCAAPAVEIPDDAGQVDGSFHFMTSDTAYVAQVEDGMLTLEAPVTFLNVSDEPVYFTGCHPPHQPFLERRLGDDWVRAFDPVFLMCLSPPVVVEPGERLDHTYIGHAGLPGETDVHPQWQLGDVEGEYRLQWDFIQGGTLENGYEVENGLPGRVYSNTFRVTVE